jgi:hypothetical protein
MSYAVYFRNLAVRLKRLGQSCFDLGVAGELREIAGELERKSTDAGGRQRRRAQDVYQKPRSTNFDGDG